MRVGIIVDYPEAELATGKLRTVFLKATSDPVNRFFETLLYMGFCVHYNLVNPRLQFIIVKRKDLSANPHRCSLVLGSHKVAD